jgi:hypothetical protein
MPCAAPADGYCNFHGNPAAARKLGAKGGRGNRRRVLEPIEIPDGMSIVELRDKTLEVMQLTVNGEISSHDAIAFTQLSKQYQRLLGIAEQLARLEILEQRGLRAVKIKVHRSQADPGRPGAGAEAE